MKKKTAGLDRLACIVLAAGKGTRMKSNKAKVLHTVLGAPLCAYPIERARELGAEPVVAVLGHQLAEVEARPGRPLRRGRHHGRRADASRRGPATPSSWAWPRWPRRAGWC